MAYCPWNGARKTMNANENAEKRLCARCGQPERRHARNPPPGPEVWQRLMPASPEGAWLCPKFIPHPEA